MTGIKFSYLDDASECDSLQQNKQDDAHKTVAFFFTCETDHSINKNKVDWSYILLLLQNETRVPGES
jgi:hypothetical protein